MYITYMYRHNNLTRTVTSNTIILLNHQRIVKLQQHFCLVPKKIKWHLVTLLRSVDHLPFQTVAERLIKGPKCQWRLKEFHFGKLFYM